jgi:hypothetical protein
MGLPHFLFDGGLETFSLLDKLIFKLGFLLNGSGERLVFIVKIVGYFCMIKELLMISFSMVAEVSREWLKNSEEMLDCVWSFLK